MQEKKELAQRNQRKLRRFVLVPWVVFIIISVALIFPSDDYPWPLFAMLLLVAAASSIWLYFYSWWSERLQKK
jgi:hypothetical protein